MLKNQMVIYVTCANQRKFQGCSTSFDVIAMPTWVTLVSIHHRNASWGHHRNEGKKLLGLLPQNSLTSRPSHHVAPLHTNKPLAKANAMRSTPRPNFLRPKRVGLKKQAELIVSEFRSNVAETQESATPHQPHILVKCQRKLGTRQRCPKFYPVN